MPGFNEILNAKGAAFGGGRSAYTRMKKQWAKKIAWAASMQGFEPVERGHFTYLFREPSRRRDPSNVMAGVKFLEDALQLCGLCSQCEKKGRKSGSCESAECNPLLPNDGWNEVLGIRPHVVLDKEWPGVTLFVGAATLDVEQAMMMERERG